MEVRLKYALTAEENLRAFRNFHDLETSLEGLSFDVFADIKKLLLAQDDKVACVWRACDPPCSRHRRIFRRWRTGCIGAAFLTVGTGF